MGYKFSIGQGEQGDIVYSSDLDEDTKIDFEEDQIKLVANGTEYFAIGTGSTNVEISGVVGFNGGVTILENGRVGIGTTAPDYKLDVAGNVGVNQYIYHNGDANTFINFTDNRVRINAGGNNHIDCQDNSSAPHKVRINNGGNNIDFVIKDNSGNVYFTADASTTRVGIGTETPTYDLDVSGNVGFNEYIYHNDDDDTFIRFQDDSITFQAGNQELLTLTEAAQDEVVINENNNDVDFRVESSFATHMFYIDGANHRIGVGTNSPQSVLHIVDPLDGSGVERDAVIIMKSKKETGIKLIADSGNDNSGGEENNPFVDFYQDGQTDTSGRGQRNGSIAMEGPAATTFTGSLANAFFMDAHVPNTPHSNRPLQLASDSTNGGHAARITLEGTNGHVGIHTSTPSTEMEVIGTTKSDFFATDVTEQDLGSGTSSTLSTTSGLVLLDADSINGIDMGIGVEVHSLAFPPPSVSGQKLTIIAKNANTNNTMILPSGLISGSFSQLHDSSGISVLSFVWVSVSGHAAWYQTDQV